MPSAIFDNPEYVKTNGVELAVYRAGPSLDETKKPPVFFLHGFPEMAYSWRLQMEYFADAGYSVFAPDQRGYGKSEKPDGVESYTMKILAEDLAGLLDHYGLDEVVFVGHDWGAIILWSLPLYIKDRIKGMAALNVAQIPHYPVSPVDVFRSHFGPDMYIVRFQDEGKSEAILEKDVRATMRFFMRVPGDDRDPEKVPADQTKNLDMLGMIQKGEDAWGGELLLPDDELQYYIDAFEAGGFTAPLHWYRNMTNNWEAEKPKLVDGVLPFIDKPALMITAELDRACPPQLADGLEKRVAPYTRVDLKGCGHWSQQQMPDEVNSSIHSWLQEHFG
jgi:pimeloyl-ACP methyl ester carboxylesterase